MEISEKKIRDSQQILTDLAEKFIIIKEVEINGYLMKQSKIKN